MKEYTDDQADQLIKSVYTGRNVALLIVCMNSIALSFSEIPLSALFTEHPYIIVSLSLIIFGATLFHLFHPAAAWCVCIGIFFLLLGIFWKLIPGYIILPTSLLGAFLMVAVIRAQSSLNIIRAHVQEVGKKRSSALHDDESLP